MPRILNADRECNIFISHVPSHVGLVMALVMFHVCSGHFGNHIGSANILCNWYNPYIFLV